MEIVGVDLASLPWPVAVLVLVIIGFTIFINFVYIPLVDEVNRLKKIENEDVFLIKETILNFESTIISILNNYDIENKLSSTLQTFREVNENKFDSILSLSNEIIRATHDLGVVFDRFDNEFKDKLRLELKELREFNKEYFINIVTILTTMEKTNQKILTDIDKLDEELKNFIRDLDNNITLNQRNTENIKDKMNTFCNQIESIKEKVQMISMAINRYPPNFQG